MREVRTSCSVSNFHNSDVLMLSSINMCAAIHTKSLRTELISLYKKYCSNFQNTEKYKHAEETSHNFFFQNFRQIRFIE